MQMDYTAHFTANFVWFNQFFNDLQGLLNQIAAAFDREFQLADPKFYYEKRTSIPSLPPYHLTGLAGRGYSVQIYTILDSSIVRNQSLTNELSFVVVKHSRSDRSLYANAYGLRILDGNAIKIASKEQGILSGSFVGGDSNGVQFQAFQVPLAVFFGQVDADKVIQEYFVSRLINLPAFTDISSGETIL